MKLKALPLIISTVLTMSALSGCGGGGASEGENASGTSNANSNASGTNNVTTSNTASGAPAVANPSDYSTAVLAAMTSGDARKVESTSELVTAISSEIERNQQKFNQFGIDLFKLNSDGSIGTNSLTNIEWNPRHDAALLTPVFGENTAVLVTNNNQAGDFSGPGDALAVAGKRGDTPYLVLGSNPTRTDASRDNANEINAEMEQFLRNGFEWLTGSDLNSLESITIAQLDNSHWFKDDSSMRTWLYANGNPDLMINEANACDGDALANCLEDTQLLIISQQLNTGEDAAQIANAAKSAMASGVPVLYVHKDGNYGDLAKALFPLWDVNYAQDNSRPKELLQSFSGQDSQNYVPGDLAQIETTLKHLTNETLSFDFSSYCTDNECELPEAYHAEFKAGADAIRSLVQGYDKNHIDLFAQAGNEAYKLAVLAADRLRQNIQYPLIRSEISTATWLSAYFADHAVYNFRKVNPTQPDLGNFSRTDFSHVTPTSKTVDMTTRGGFRATGTYALPGQTFIVRRLDNNPNVATNIFVNTQRSGSTHEWDQTGYKRPKYLSSARVPVAQGETIYMTSPYGGPIQVGYNTGGEDIELSIENVGLHAYWASPADDVHFEAALAANDFDWVEVSSASFEMHSTHDKFVNSTIVGQKFWWDAQTLVDASMEYSHNYPNLLAGMQGDGIDRVEEIHGWAETNGYTVAQTSKLQHMNADQATCGGLCSGNPYDSYGAYNPISHGNLHEIGHNIQLNKAILTYGGGNGGSHAATNFYSFYTTQRFFEKTGEHKPDIAEKYKHTFCGMETSDIDKNVRTMFDKAVSAASEANPDETMSALQDPGHYDYNYFVFDQIRYQARNWNRLDNGYHAISRLHILWKNFSSALKNDETWDAQKNNLGFGHYTRGEAQAISNNDWILIAASWALELDFSNHLGMMGILSSDKAKSQVTAFGFAKVKRELITSNNKCAASTKNSRALNLGTPFVKHVIAITPDAVWPWE
jgi:immunomodulating metalloprotease